MDLISPWNKEIHLQKEPERLKIKKWAKIYQMNTLKKAADMALLSGKAEFRLESISWEKNKKVLSNTKGCK